MHDLGAGGLQAHLDPLDAAQAPRPAAETLARCLLRPVEIEPHAHAAPCRLRQSLDEGLIDEKIGGDIDRMRRRTQERKVDAFEIGGGRVVDLDLAVA